MSALRHSLLTVVFSRNWNPDHEILLNTSRSTESSADLSPVLAQTENKASPLRSEIRSTAVVPGAQPAPERCMCNFECPNDRGWLSASRNRDFRHSAPSRVCCAPPRESVRGQPTPRLRHIREKAAGLSSGPRVQNACVELVMGSSVHITCPRVGKTEHLPSLLQVCPPIT